MGKCLQKKSDGRPCGHSNLDFLTSKRFQVFQQSERNRDFNFFTEKQSEK